MVKTSANVIQKFNNLTFLNEIIKSYKVYIRFESEEEIRLASANDLNLAIVESLIEMEKEKARNTPENAIGGGGGDGGYSVEKDNPDDFEEQDPYALAWQQSRDTPKPISYRDENSDTQSQQQQRHHHKVISNIDQGKILESYELKKKKVKQNVNFSDTTEAKDSKTFKVEKHNKSNKFRSKSVLRDNTSHLSQQEPVELRLRYESSSIKLKSNSNLI